MEPVLNEARIEYESRLRLKAVKIKLSFPQQIVEEHEHVRDTTHPPKHYGCIYVTRLLYEVTFPMSYRNVGSSCPHYRERRRSPHRADSDALYAVGGGNTGPASSVTTNFTPYYLDEKYRREDTPVYDVIGQYHHTSLVHKILRHDRRGKGMAESFSREKLRHAPQKQGG